MEKMQRILSNQPDAWITLTESKDFLKDLYKNEGAKAPTMIRIVNSAGGVM